MYFNYGRMLAEIDRARLESKRGSAFCYKCSGIFALFGIAFSATPLFGMIIICAVMTLLFFLAGWKNGYSKEALDEIHKKLSSDMSKLKSTNGRGSPMYKNSFHYVEEEDIEGGYY